MCNVQRFRRCIHLILERWAKLAAIDVDYGQRRVEHNFGTLIISLFMILAWYCTFYYALIDHKYAHIPSFHPMYSLCVAFAGLEVRILFSPFRVEYFLNFVCRSFLNTFSWPMHHHFCRYWHSSKASMQKMTKTRESARIISN